MPRINQRFLPWHRVYLAKFEEMLNNVMKKETGEDHNIAHTISGIGSMIMNFLNFSTI